ncbi:MAG: sulfite exporter TauE/SafE family protein [Oscillospiraceae bacterium]|nr:sulfite exporter TauE/SafE family protein [Oscillospiraceae bacterium]
MKQRLKTAAAGFLAGAVNGLFGAGGGMVLVPLLTLLTDIEDKDVFPASVSVILPICVVSLSIGAMTQGLPIMQALPYLIGSIGGGILAGITAKRIPVKWLHRGLGLLILWGGVRYLC